MNQFVSMKIDSELLERIDEAARRDRRTRSDMIRILVADALKSRLDLSAGQAVELKEAMEAAK